MHSFLRIFTSLHVNSMLAKIQFTHLQLEKINHVEIKISGKKIKHYLHILQVSKQLSILYDTFLIPTTKLFLMKNEKRIKETCRNIIENITKYLRLSNL